MKLKTLATIAASGLMAASFAYVVPAYAEEFSGDEEVMAPQQLALADNSSASSGLPGDVGGGMNNTNNSGNNTGANNAGNNSANRMGTATSANAASTTSPAASGNTVTPNNEQGTPDVASGDDDY